MIFISPEGENSKIYIFFGNISGVAYYCDCGKKVYTKSYLELDEKTGKIKVFLKEEMPAGNYMPTSCK